MVKVNMCVLVGHKISATRSDLTATPPADWDEERTEKGGEVQQLLFASLPLIWKMYLSFGMPHFPFSFSADKLWEYVQESEEKVQRGARQETPCIVA